MADKPSYIGLLNAISNGERRGHELLNCWAKTTPNKEIAGLLNIVAIREAEHAWAFEKRLCELGFGLQPREDAKHAERMACVASNSADCEKFAFLDFGRDPNADNEDGLLKVLADKTIDPQTGALLGRFIAEERDSGRLLAKARALANADMQRQSMTAAPSSAVLDQICAQLNALNEKVEALSRVQPLRAVS